MVSALGSGTFTFFLLVYQVLFVMLEQIETCGGKAFYIPTNTLANAEPRRKWKFKCGKALFALGLQLEKSSLMISQNSNPIKSYKCGKIEHIKKNCKVDISKANVASENEGDEPFKWEQCFTTEVVEGKIDATAKTVPVKLFSTMKAASKNGLLILAALIISIYPLAKGVMMIAADDTRRVELNDVFHVPDNVKVLNNVKNVAAYVVLTGERKGYLFVMIVGEAYVKKTSQTDSPAIWHARLGHLGY
ncbi:hypothetical protein ACH5RR_002686 [Cinchona calisaya]|uniref:GAG-pre-integrase domain-containing protein n=1 Tax=Cinchona calisaya TaxID=153742 RepID=A0ABD3ASP8_9GENT